MDTDAAKDAFDQWWEWVWGAGGSIDAVARSVLQACSE
jgi:hypothetical protein